MKKKELISKIDSLITSLNRLNAELVACRAENAELKGRIEELSLAALEKEAKLSVEEETEIQEEVIEETETVEENLMQQNEQEEEPDASEPTEELSEKKVLNILPIGEKVVLPDSIMEFGSEIIGKIVIESAKYADMIAASATPNKKELLNLIMGKGEVCKAEILNAVSSSASTDTKISLINAQLAEAIDYFKSVVAQI